jgi:predicted RecB family nuclease
MGAKDGFTSLSDTVLLDAEQLRSLREFGVTTVEELISLLDTQLDRVGRVLGLNEGQCARLRADAEAALPEERLKDLDATTDFDFPPPGAWQPEQEL